MNGEAWVQAAAQLPAPIFVLIVAALMIFSIGGFPVPITATLLLAGALTTRLPNGALLFVALVIAVTAALTLRDGVTLLIGRHGGRLFARRAVTIPGHTAIPAAVAVRSRLIALPAARVARQQHRRAARLKTLTAAQRLLMQQGAPVLALTRLSPLASPFDIAAGMLGMPLRRYLPPIAAGRLLHGGLLLGAGALSATAWKHGASLPQLAGIVSLVLILLIILPGVVSRRAMARQAAPTVAEPSVREDPIVAAR